MTREEKIELIRKVYGEKAVEGCEGWELVMVYDSPEQRKKVTQVWVECDGWQSLEWSCLGRLGRYPRETPKPKCIVEDVEVQWIDGEMVVNNYWVKPFVGNNGITHAGRDDWQIAEFLFAERSELELIPIVNHDGSYIRANRVRLVRWEGGES